jgi:hypothetical protein
MNNLSANISNYTAITNNNKKFNNPTSVNNTINSNNPCKNPTSPQVISSDKVSNINNDISPEFNNIKNEIVLRNLCPTDIFDLKELCAEWFPVE